MWTLVGVEEACLLSGDQSLGGWGCRSRGRLHTMHGTASGSETHRRQAREGQAETIRWAGPRTLGSRRSRYRTTRTFTDDQVLCLFKPLRHAGNIVQVQHKGWGNGVSVCLQGPFPLGESSLDAQGTSRPKHLIRLVRELQSLIGGSRSLLPHLPSENAHGWVPGLCL